MRVHFADVVVDTRTRETSRGGEPVHLSPKAFELLLILIESRPQAVAKTALQDRLWPDTFVVEKNLTNLVAEIRKALGDTSSSPRFIRTVQRFGYALRDASGPSRTEGGGAVVGACAVRLTWADGQAILGEGQYLVGRAPEAAVCLDADSVSRRHAMITVTATSATVEDLGSKNGTAIGSSRIDAAARLANGDRLRIGRLVLTVHLAGGVGDSTRTVTVQGAPPAPASS